MKEAAVNALIEERNRYMEALGSIARRTPSKRLDSEFGASDFIDAYDTMIEVARAALKGTLHGK